MADQKECNLITKLAYEVDGIKRKYKPLLSSKEGNKVLDYIDAASALIWEQERNAYQAMNAKKGGN